MSLSVVSLITFIVSKIAVGIFAGRGGIRDPPARDQPQSGRHGHRSFWIGSVAVIVLTGLYTALGGMRAVAYNDAVQVCVLIGGSVLLTFLRAPSARRLVRTSPPLCSSQMFNLWRPISPRGVASTSGSGRW